MSAKNRQSSFDNSFAEQLQKSGFLKELWGPALR